LGATERSHDIFKVFLGDAVMRVETSPDFLVFFSPSFAKAFVKKGLSLKKQ
jgi:hypothetical protein